MLGRYTQLHKKNIIRMQPFNNILKAQKGMILKIWYEGADIPHHILVLNPKYRKPGERDWKLHAIKLDDFPIIAFNTLAETYGIKWIPLYQKFKGLDVTKLIQEISSQRFYRGEVKRLMKRHPSYRTYVIRGIKIAKLIDYKFPDEIEKKYLGILNEVETNTEKRHTIK